MNSVTVQESVHCIIFISQRCSRIEAPCNFWAPCSKITWYLGFTSAAWVFIMVVLGGVTRLTRSGLSMTDWKFTVSLPPLSDEAWVVEFEKYKQSPEYQR